MFCGKCGNQLQEGSSVCAACGAEVPVQNDNQMNQQPVNQPPIYPNYQPPVNQPNAYQNYQQPVYPGYQPQPYAPAVRNPKDGRGFSITALVLGICGVVLCWIGGLNVLILALGILGIIFGVIGRKKSAAAYGKASGLATAGLVLGIIGTAICGLGVLACAACVGEAVACQSLLGY